MINTKLILAVAPKAKDPAKWALYCDKVFNEHGITDKSEVCMLLAQMAHESNDFNTLTENLHYTAPRLLAVFPKYFNSTNVADYACNDQAIASRVYANRLGNGSEASKDGWVYRGRGCIQITGRDNYTAFSKWCGLDFVTNPAPVADHEEIAVLASVWFWLTRVRTHVLTFENVREITRLVNGGVNGLKDRAENFQDAMNSMA